jgi:hypothetical protein
MQCQPLSFAARASAPYGQLTLCGSAVPRITAPFKPRGRATRENRLCSWPRSLKWKTLAIDAAFFRELAA